jgi:hypothetical protein
MIFRSRLQHCWRLLFLFVLFMGIFHKPSCATTPQIHSDIQLKRGIEYDVIQIQLRSAQKFDTDSLNISLHVDGLNGYRELNADNRRITEALNFVWISNSKAKFSRILRLNETLYNEKRSLRETIKGDVSVGILSNILNSKASLAAGYTYDQRQSGTDAGPLIEADFTTAGHESGWNWTLASMGRLANSGQRRDRTSSIVLSTGYKSDRAEQKLAVSFFKESDDVYPQPLFSVLERRTRQNINLENTIVTQVLDWLSIGVDVNAWKREQDRDGLGRVSSNESNFADTGLAARVSSRAMFADFISELEFESKLQNQNSSYDTNNGRSGNKSKIKLNELGLGLRRVTKSDSLFLHSSIEMRRRDTEFISESTFSQPEDKTDRLFSVIQTGYRRTFFNDLRLGLDLRLSQKWDRHLTAQMSSSNFHDQSWHIAFIHKTRFVKKLKIWGRTGLISNYRKFDFDTQEIPRSWIQRRFSHTEHLRFNPLGEFRVAGNTISYGLSADISTLLEDSGSYLKHANRELLSNSSRELNTDFGMPVSIRAVKITPGIHWYNLQRFQWSFEDETRIRNLTRNLYRRGPQLSIDYLKNRKSMKFKLLWEQVNDNNRRSWNLWINLRLVFVI